MNGKIGSRSFLQRYRLHDSRPCSGADPRCFPFGPAAGTYRMSRRLAILPICTVLSTNRLPSLIRAVGKGTLPAASAEPVALAANGRCCPGYKPSGRVCRCSAHRLRGLPGFLSAGQGSLLCTAVWICPFPPRQRTAGDV